MKDKDELNWKRLPELLEVVSLPKEIDYYSNFHDESFEIEFTGANGSNQFLSLNKNQFELLQAYTIFTNGRHTKNKNTNDHHYTLTDEQFEDVKQLLIKYSNEAMVKLC